MKRMAASGLALGVALLSAGAALAQTTTFEGVGEALVSSGDQVRARARALDDGLRQAIDAAAASLYDPAALEERRSTLKLQVEPRVRSYVVGYRVLDEGEQSGSFRVHVSAEVDLARLERDLGRRSGAAGASSPVLLKSKGVACLVEREAGEGVFHASPAEATLLGALRARAAASSIANCPTRGDAPDDLRAADEARRARAIAVVATAVSQPSGAIRGTQLVGAHAELDLHVIDTQGRLIASLRRERDAYGRDAQAAARAAIDSAAGDATAELDAALTPLFPRGDGVAVYFTGLERYVDLSALQRALGLTPGASSVEPRRFSPQGGELLVRGNVTSDALARSLTRSSDAARFTVASRDPRSLLVHVLPPPPPPPPEVTPGPMGATQVITEQPPASSPPASVR